MKSQFPSFPVSQFPSPCLCRQVHKVTINARSPHEVPVFQSLIAIRAEVTEYVSVVKYTM